MKCLTTIVLVLSSLFTKSVSAQEPATEPAAKTGFVELFNGKDLTGWTQKNGTASYQVVGGTILGCTAAGSPNSFLCSDKEYGNFELMFDVKVDNALNSGVQIRSKTRDPAAGQKFGRVYGPQVEIEASGAKGAESGYIYGEATDRGWLTPEDRLKPRKIFKDDEWNSYRVLAEGPRIQTWINGEAIEDLTDEPIFQTHPSGFIGLQVHAIGAGSGPYVVQWRNIKICELASAKE